MLLKLLNLRKYFDEIVFEGGALRFWLEAFTKYMSPCQLLLLGQQWWETRVFKFQQDVTATAWGSSWVASYLFFPCHWQDFWGQRLRGKIWFALCQNREQVTQAPNLPPTSISKWKQFSVSNTQTLVFLQIRMAWATESLFWLKFRAVLFTITSLNKQH